jgi:hypothetical protein
MDDISLPSVVQILRPLTGQFTDSSLVGARLGAGSVVAVTVVII